VPTFKFGDDTYKIETLPTQLACEAEAALGVDPFSGKFALMAVQLFVAMRQAHPERPAGVIADAVNSADWLTLEVAEEEEPPLADEPEEGVPSEEADQEEADALATTGRPR
jgi:hypothetical protein